MFTAAINKRRLFQASSLALVVTAMSFAIRANLLGLMGEEFGLAPGEMGEIAAAAFWGFTIAMLLGGPLADWMGLGKMYLIAFLCHLGGVLLTIFSDGYWLLFTSTLFVGVANGFIEAASYTMISSLYPDDKARKINDWHIWFPGGIVIGGLIAYFLSVAGWGWRIQMATMILPTLIYGWLFLKQEFPKSERLRLGISNSDMIKACTQPIFLFMVACMFLTAATELGTNQWIAALLTDKGIPSILLLVSINGIMALGRANAGLVLKKISTTGLLFWSAVFSCAGLLLLAHSTGWLTFLAAAIFALGICYFWPTMIGFVSEHLYKTGPPGLSIMGGAGLLSTALVLPFMGQFYEKKLTGATALEAGRDTLQATALMPAVLIIAFAILHFSFKTSRKPQ